MLKEGRNKKFRNVQSEEEKKKYGSMHDYRGRTNCNTNIKINHILGINKARQASCTLLNCTYHASGIFSFKLSLHVPFRDRLYSC